MILEELIVLIIVPVFAIIIITAHSMYHYKRLNKLSISKKLFWSFACLLAFVTFGLFEAPNINDYDKKSWNHK